MRDKGATDPTPETGLRESLRRAFEPHLGVFALLFALAWIAYGVHAAGLLFSIDDWEFTLGEPGAVERMIAFGRWVQALSIRYIAGETLAPAVSLFLMLALQGAALALFLETTVQREGTTVFLVLALVLFHPLGIESVQVEQNHVAAGIALGANILAGTLAWRVAREGSGIALSRAAPILLGASALLMLGAAAFQQFAALTPMAFLLAWALDPKASGYGPSAAVRRLAVIGGVSMIGVALYYASAFVAKAIAGIGAEAASYYYDITSGFAADAGTLAIKRRDVPVMIQQVYFGPQHLIGMGEKLAILALLVLALAGGLRRALAAPSGLPRLIDGGVLLGTLGVMMLLPFVLPTIRYYEVESYNALAPLAFTHAGIALLALALWRGHRLRIVAIALSGYLIANFILMQNAAAVVSLNENRRDFVAASQLLADLRRTEVYRTAAAAPDGTVRLVFAGHRPAPEPGAYAVDRAPAPLDSSRADCGLLTCGPAGFAHALTLLDDGRVRFVSVAAGRLDRALAEEAVRALTAATPWPDPSGIILLSNGHLVIFIGRDGQGGT